MQSEAVHGAVGPVSSSRGAAQQAVVGWLQLRCGDDWERVGCDAVGAAFLIERGATHEYIRRKEQLRGAQKNVARDRGLICRWDGQKCDGESLGRAVTAIDRASPSLPSKVG
jgi:hypothetical protein